MATWDELGIDVRGHRGIQKVKCPVCSEGRKNKSDKSLSIDLNKGAYNCHNCGWSGYVSGKTTEEERSDWKQQNKQQREWAKPAVVELPLSDKVIDWFAKRGIQPETLQYFKVTESLDWMPERGNKPAGKRTCINFNYYRGEEKVNIKYRDALKCFRLTKNAELVLYNLNALTDRTDMLICEGEIDAMTFYQAGHYGAVSVPNGASKGSARLDYLDNCWSVFEKMEKIVIATDCDEAGAYLRDELVRRLGPQRCWLVAYPEGCKDANEVLLKYGQDAVRKLWETATAPPIEDILMVADMEDKLDTIYLKGWPKIEPIGYLQFDQLINFAPGEVTTITGIPQHGKDEFIRQILIRKAVRYGEKAFIFNYEEPAWIQAIKAFQQYVGKPFYRRDRGEMMNAAQKDAAYKFINNHLYFVDIQSADLTLDGLLKKASEMILRKDVRYVVLGPYNCIEGKRESWMTEGEYVSIIYQKLTYFALRHNIHIFFVAHTTKMSKDKNTGQFEIPNLYSISGSANFFNKTHNGLTIYRNYEECTTDVHVQKVKFFFNGQLGRQTFQFDVNTARYTEIGTPFESELDFQRKQEVQTELIMKPSPVLPPEPPLLPNSLPTGNVNLWDEPLKEDEVPF